MNNKSTNTTKRSIYAGVLYHDEEFSLDRLLYGKSQYVSDNYRKELSAWRKNKSRSKRNQISISNEKSMIRGTIRESILEADIYPVRIVYERPNGSRRSHTINSSSDALNDE